MKKWLRLAVVVCPLLFLLVFMNYYIDPANLFHDVTDEMADALLGGNRAYFKTANADMADVKKVLVERMPERPECVVLGSSRTMGIDAEITQSASFYNLSYSLATYYDFIALFGVMQMQEKRPERVILGLQTSFFDEILDGSSETARRYEKNRPYAEYMLQLLEEQEGEATIPYGQSVKTEIETLEQLFSLTYFQSAAELVWKNGISYYGKHRVGIVDSTYEGAYWKPDGSHIYGKATLQQDVEHVREAAKEYPLTDRISPGVEIAEKNKRVFIKLIEYLADQGTEVELFLIPDSPSLWNRVDPDEFPIVNEVNEFVKDYAEENGVKVTGDLNPYNLGMTDADFYDCSHIRKERLSVYFDFTD